MKEFLEIAKIVGTHGIRGEMRCQTYCDFPEVFCDFENYYLGKDKEIVDKEHAFVHKNIVVLKLFDIDTLEDAQKLVGQYLYINRNDGIMADDVFFIQDIIGCTVKNAETGEVYGKVTDVYQNGAADVFSMKQPDGRELMFPYIDDVVKSIDVENGIILIIPLDGLFEDAEDAEDTENAKDTAVKDKE